MCAALVPVSLSLPLSSADRHRQDPVRGAASETPRDESDTQEREYRSIEEENLGSGEQDAPTVPPTESEPVSNQVLCMQQCYHSRMPEEKIEYLRTTYYQGFVADCVHPGFFLAEYLESYHRWSFCENWVPGLDCEARPEEEGEGETLRQKTHDILHLVRTKVETELGYTVVFDRAYYPRYLVNMPYNCSEPMKYQKYLSGTWSIVDRYPPVDES